MFWIEFAVFLAACAAAGASGGLFPPGAWYRSLAKPGFTPPDWFFPIAWTTIYLLISFAAARVAAADGASLALALWALQIALNTLWTPVFFGLKNMRAALGVVVALWVAVAATMIVFWSIDWVAGAAFAVYLAWVTTAGALNFQVMRLNPTTSG